MVQFKAVQGVFHYLDLDYVGSFSCSDEKLNRIWDTAAYTAHLNMQEFLSQTSSMDEMLRLVKKSVLWDLFFEYPDINYFDKENFSRAMQDVYQQTKCPFVIIIDEWDCIFREYKSDKEAQEQYLDFLRDFLKDKSYIHLAYMTGILPVKKYGTHFIHAGDEWYILAERPMPEETTYDGYLQLENGVGMMRLFITEFTEALEQVKSNPGYLKMREEVKRTVTIATGKLTYATICSFAERMMEAFPGLQIHVFAIRNDFFGETITVSGLITGQDLTAQIKEYQENSRKHFVEKICG